MVVTHKTILLQNVSTKEMVVYLEFFVPYVYHVAPKQEILVHVFSTDPKVIDEETCQFSIWFDSEGLAVYPPGRGDLIEDFYVVDNATGRRLEQILG